MQKVLSALCAELGIPVTYYERARDRYKSIGNYLKRGESEVAQWNPHIYVQGSFRYGTVVKPIANDGEYDLDIVCELTGQAKAGTTQQGLKAATGRELGLYATGHNMKSKPKEGRKCWHVQYADEIKFHIDGLPAIPEDAENKGRIAAALKGIDSMENLAQLAIAITDNCSASYAVLSRNWPSSNPRGYGRWFESRMRASASTRMRALVDAGRYPAIDEVPAYEWRTPLQQAIQVLKRHRDVMFLGNRAHKPISMIITTLAAHAYRGESSIGEAIPGIIARMPDFVRPSGHRIPNPVNPSEDFADKWTVVTELEDCFWMWMKQVTRDVALLGTTRDLAGHLEANFAVRFHEGERKRIIVPAAAGAAPRVQIKERTRPWGHGLV